MLLTKNADINCMTHYLSVGGSMIRLSKTFICVNSFIKMSDF